MALTLQIGDRRLSHQDFSPNASAGVVQQQGAWCMTDGVRDALLSAAAELKGISRPGKAEEAPPRRMRLKLYADSLGAMEEKGWLPAEAVRAGREIARAFEAVTKGRSGPAMFSYGEERGGRGDGDVPPWLRAAFNDRFLPWSEWARGQLVNPVGKLTMRDLTFLVCVEGLGQRQAADLLAMDQRRLLRLLQASLWWYAERAGWVSAPAIEVA